MALLCTPSPTLCMPQAPVLGSPLPRPSLLKHPLRDAAVEAEPREVLPWDPLGLQQKGRSSSSWLGRPGLARAHRHGSWQAGTHPARHQNPPSPRGSAPESLLPRFVPAAAHPRHGDGAWRSIPSSLSSGKMNLEVTAALILSPSGQISAAGRARCPRELGVPGDLGMCSLGALHQRGGRRARRAELISPQLSTSSSFTAPLRRLGSLIDSQRQGKGLDGSGVGPDPAAGSRNGPPGAAERPRRQRRCCTSRMGPWWVLGRLLGKHGWKKPHCRGGERSSAAPNRHGCHQERSL